MLKHRKYTRGIYTVVLDYADIKDLIKLSENMSSSAYKPNTWHLSVFIDINIYNEVTFIQWDITIYWYTMTTSFSC